MRDRVRGLVPVVSGVLWAKNGLAKRDFIFAVEVTIVMDLVYCTPTVESVEKVQDDARCGARCGVDIQIRVDSENLEDIVVTALANVNAVGDEQDDTQDAKDVTNIEDIDYSKSMANLSTEILVKILLYLPLRDKMTIRHVSRKLRGVSEIPLLWKEFVWLDCEPRHMHSMMKLLKIKGNHVRRIFFPAHVTPTKLLEMAHYCRKVTHLSIPGDTQLRPSDVKKVICMMTNLEQLEVLLNRSLMQCTDISYSRFIERLIKDTAGVKELKIPFWASGRAVTIIKELADQGNPLPSVISVLTEHSDDIASELFLFWSKSSSELPPFEISLYNNKRIPMNLYPSVPLSKFQFGSPVTTPPLIRLNNRGIVGLNSVEDDIFYFSEYDDYGTVRHTITPIGFVQQWLGYVKNSAKADFFDQNSHKLLIEEKHFNHINHLNSVSYIDISNSNVHFNHLEKLAIACPNLQRLNLTGNENCLNDLQGLHAIVQKCQNLEGLNLAKISVSRIECYLILWELLSSLKKLSHLAIDLCMIKSHDSDKLISIFRKCHNLKALELHRFNWCKECRGTVDYLFSHFPSLMYCRMSDFHYSGFKYALTN